MNIGAILNALFGGLINATIMQPFISVLSSMTTEMVAMNNDFTTSLFDNNTIQAFLIFIGSVGSIFFLFGIAFAFSEWAIEFNEGNISTTIFSTFKNAFIGFAALSGFSTLPILLLKFTNDICTTLCKALTGANVNYTMNNIWSSMKNLNFFSGWGEPIFVIIIFVCVIRIFLANIKRGGILIILITVGSLHLFSVPRGYTDAFWSWCRQVVGICITSFLQNLLLILGIVLYASSGMDVFDLILGAGVMLSASEVPRILQQFGLDTSMKTNVTQAIFGVSGIMNIASAFMK